jgi:hypothetical protein
LINRPTDGPKGIHARNERQRQHRFAAEAHMLRRRRPKNSPKVQFSSITRHPLDGLGQIDVRFLIEHVQSVNFGPAARFKLKYGQRLLNRKSNATECAK